MSWAFTINDIDNPQSAWSPDWFPDSHVVYDRGSDIKDLKPADVIGIYFRSKERIAHGGFFYRYDEHSGMAITVEGNTNEGGAREGDGVYKKRRHPRVIYKASRWIQ
ncbi:MAG: hypothetical protein ACQETE_01525 [Bacteroidota bacterium]